MNDVDMYYVYLVYRISCTICYSLYYFIYGLILFFLKVSNYVFYREYFHILRIVVCYQKYVMVLVYTY